MVGKPETIFTTAAHVDRLASQHMICKFRIGQHAFSDARKVHIIILNQKSDLLLRPDLVDRDHRDACFFLDFTSAIGRGTA